MCERLVYIMRRTTNGKVAENGYPALLNAPARSLSGYDSVAVAEVARRGYSFLCDVWGWERFAGSVGGIKGLG